MDGYVILRRDLSVTRTSKSRPHASYFSKETLNRVTNAQIDFATVEPETYFISSNKGKVRIRREITLEW